MQTWLKPAICYTNYTVVVKRVCSSYNPAPTAGLIPEAQENSHFHATGARKRNLSFSKNIFENKLKDLKPPAQVRLIAKTLSLNKCSSKN